MIENMPEKSRFDKETQDNIAKIFTSNKPSPDLKQVYHYTTIEALLSILKKKELWLTNVRYQNDRYELYDFIPNTVKALKSFDGKRYKELANHFIENQVDDNEDYFMQASIFMFSLCENGNSIPMWNYYAQGNGVSIGINANELINETNKTFANSKLIKEIRFVKCAYIDKYKILKIEKVIKEAEKEELDIDTLKICLWNEMIKYSPIFKNEDFLFEKEKRLVLTLNKGFNSINEEDENKSFSHDFVSSNNSIKPVIKLKYKEKLPIKSIYISPLNNDETLEKGLKRIFEFYGYNQNEVEIIKAKSALRNK